MENTSTVYPEWQNLALPVLQWIKGKEDQNRGAPLTIRAWHLDEIAQAVGLPTEQAAVQITRLINAGLVTGERAGAQGGVTIAFGKVALTLQGLQAVGAWPGPPSEEQVMSLLESLASQMPPDSRERSGIEKLAEGLKSLGRDTFIHVIGELAKMGAGKAMGLS